ncbi:MAG: putative rane protein [Sphingomonas bacterium]|nr:putative rane protein [Sphingomonas bacterium]
MAQIIKAALAYFVIVFGLGFALGALRVLVIIPHIGETAAVLLELPVMLAASWVAAGWCVRHFAVPVDVPARLAVGVLAFALVMVAELALAVLLFGQSPAQHVETYRHFAGVAGLAAQLAYALFPVLRRGGAGALG